MICPIVVYMFPATDVKEFPDMFPDAVSAPVAENAHTPFLWQWISKCTVPPDAMRCADQSIHHYSISICDSTSARLRTPLVYKSVQRRTTPRCASK